MSWEDVDRLTGWHPRGRQCAECEDYNGTVEQRHIRNLQVDLCGQCYRRLTEHVKPRRQWSDLPPGEAIDVAGAVVRALAHELQIRRIAGSGRTVEWELADRLRTAVTEHHAEVRRRASQEHGG